MVEYTLDTIGKVITVEPNSEALHNNVMVVKNPPHDH